MTVAECMTRDPICVDPDDSIVDALLCMRAGGFRRLPVIEIGRLVGIITDRDVRAAWPSDVPRLSTWELFTLVPKITVREVMHAPVVTAQGRDSLEDAARLMLKHKIGGLPVLDDDAKVVGVVTTSDVLRALVEGTPRANHEARASRSVQAHG